MKRFLFVLIVALLLCASLGCASARTITGSETFSGFPKKMTKPYSQKGDYFVLDVSAAYSNTIPFGDSQNSFSIKPREDIGIDSAVIKSVEANVTKIWDNWPSTAFDHGKKEPEEISEHEPVVHIKDVNAPSIKATGDRFVIVDRVTVNYSVEVPDPPVTGDAANPMLWLIFAVIGAGGLIAMTVCKRGES